MPTLTNTAYTHFRTKNKQTGRQRDGRAGRQAKYDKFLALTELCGRILCCIHIHTLFLVQANTKLSIIWDDCFDVYSTTIAYTQFIYSKAKNETRLTLGSASWKGTKLETEYNMSRGKKMIYIFLFWYKKSKNVAKDVRGESKRYIFSNL